MTDITWYKRFHGTWKDPKFKVAGDMAGTNRRDALSVWDAIIEESSESDARGTILKVDRRVIAAGLDLTIDMVTRIWDAFISLGMIAGERIVAWSKRQGAAVEKLAQAAVIKAAEAISPEARRQRKHRKKVADAALEPTLPGLLQSVTPARDRRDSSVTNSVTVTTDLESDLERIPPGPPQGGATPGSISGGLMNPVPIVPRQVEILMPIQGGGDARRRRETADERRMRECKEYVARTVMACRMARDGVAASAAG